MKPKAELEEESDYSRGYRLDYNAVVEAWGELSKPQKTFIAMFVIFVLCAIIILMYLVMIYLIPKWIPL